MFFSNSEMLLIFLLFTRAYNTAKKCRKMTFPPYFFEQKETFLHGFFAQIFCTTVSEYIFDEDSEHNNSLRFLTAQKHTVYSNSFLFFIFNVMESILQPINSARCVKTLILEKSSICILLNYLPSCLM